MPPLLLSLQANLGASYLIPVYAHMHGPKATDLDVRFASKLIKVKSILTFVEQKTNSSLH